MQAGLLHKHSTLRPVGLKQMTCVYEPARRVNDVAVFTPSRLTTTCYIAWENEQLCVHADE